MKLNSPQAQQMLDDILREVQDREFDGLRVADLSEVPNDFRGAVLLVNDHGNVTLYSRNQRGFREIANRV